MHGRPFSVPPVSTRAEEPKAEPVVSARPPRLGECPGNGETPRRRDVRQRLRCFFWLGALTSRAVSRRDQNAHRERQARRGATHAARARSGFATTLARLTHARASGAFGSPVKPRREAHRTAVRGSESGNRRSPTSPLSGDGGGDGAPDGRRRSARRDVHGRRRVEEGRGRSRDTTQQEGASPSPRSVPSVTRRNSTR